MNHRLYRILMTSGVLPLVTAIGIQFYSLADDYLAGRRAEALLQRTLNQGAVPSGAAPQPVPDDAHIPGGRSPTVLEALTTGSDAMSYGTIGVLIIPRINVKLPVISTCSDALLAISVCRYKREMNPGPTRMVIAGHNYKTHFGRVPGLVPGDDVYFQDNNGVQYHYKVTELTEIDGSDHDGLESGEWNLTLLTCNRDRTRRILARCVQV